MTSLRKTALILALTTIFVTVFFSCSVSRNDSTVPSNDFHSDLQYAYLNDENIENIEAYARGKEELSRPEAIVLDFSATVDVNFFNGCSSEFFSEYSYDENFGSSTIITGLKERKTYVFNLESGKTVYFRGARKAEELPFAEVNKLEVSSLLPRNLRIDGVSNVRDVGGYSSYLAKDGKIKQGLLIRGGNLDAVSETGRKELIRLGIKREIDLRDEECCKGPFSEEVEYDTVPIPSGTESTRFEEFADEYERIFTFLADAGDYPVYLHCSAGADRTGICVFMLLTVCGAEYEDIARDYLFTNFSFYGSRLKNFSSEFQVWWKKLDRFEGESKADKAKAWLMSKGLNENDVEKIRRTFIVGY